MKEKSTGVALLLLTVFAVGGASILYFLGFWDVRSLADLYGLLERDYFAIAIPFLFMSVGILGLFSVILDKFLKSKKVLVYCLENDEERVSFIDKRGKKYKYYKSCDCIVGCFYYVMKKVKIESILESSKDGFDIPRIKESYWLNFYSPVGNFEDVFLLPILYIIIIPGILSFFASKGLMKIFGILYSLIPMYLLIYDFFYKFKKRENVNGIVDQSFYVFFSGKFLEYFKYALSISVYLVFLAVVGSFFFSVKNVGGRIFLLIFFVLGSFAFLSLLCKIFKWEKLRISLLKMYYWLFFCFWFGVLSFYSVMCVIKQEFTMIIFTIPFWVVGFLAFRRLLKRDK